MTALDDVDDHRPDVDGKEDADGAAAAADDEARFLDQAMLRGRGSLVKGILSLVKEGDPVRQLEISEAYWRAQKKSKAKRRKSSSSSSSPSRRAVVERRGAGRLLSDALSSSSSSSSSGAASSHLGDFDVVVAGGTLGLMLAAALQGRPSSSSSSSSSPSSSSSSSSSYSSYSSSPSPPSSPSSSSSRSFPSHSSSSSPALRCAVIERGPRVGGGRVQEWNCSRGELEPLAELGVLTREELDSVIVTECGPMKVSFPGSSGGKTASSPSPPPPLSSPPLTLTGVLDVGVCPVKLMALLRAKFEAAGGFVLDASEFLGAEVFDDGVLVRTRRPPAPARGARLPLMDSAPLSSCPPPPITTSSDSSRDSSPASSSSFEAPEEEEGRSSSEAATRRGASASPSSPPPPSSSSSFSSSFVDNKNESETKTLSASLLIDCMGHWSPRVKAAREGQEKPDAVCLVVGACVRLKDEDEDQAEAKKKKKSKSNARPLSLPRSGGEFLASRSHASCEGPDRDVQWLWEQFPAAGGEARTLYRFAYVDAESSRPSLEASLEGFFLELPDALSSGSGEGDIHSSSSNSSSSKSCSYKDSKRVPLSALQIDRVLFGAFPSYARAPLLPSSDRILHAGDAAGGASPLSFGGFGAMLRHLPRLVAGVPEALEASRLSAEAVRAMVSGGGGGGSCRKRAAAAAAAAASSKPLSKGALSALTPYSPSLSTTWLFAAAMRLPPGSVKSAGGREEKLEEEEEGEGGEKQQRRHRHRLHHRRQRSPSPPSSPPSSSAAHRPGAYLPGDHVSRLLSANFAVLSLLGPWAIGPFVSERVRLLPLTATMLLMGAAAPLSVLRVLRQVGPLALASWVFHAAALAAFALLRVLAAPLRGYVFAKRRRRRRGGGRRQEEEKEASATASGAARSVSPPPPPPPPSRAKLLSRALAARAFAALGRIVDALEYGSGHDGSGSASGFGGGGGHGVRIVPASSSSVAA